MKICSKCKSRPVSYANHPWCKECLVASNRVWRSGNRLRHRTLVRNAKLKERYGITPEQKAEIIKAAGGVCRACLRPLGAKTAVIDHCHSTGVVRGYVHTYCNFLIGAREKDARRWRAIDAYVTEFERSTIP